MNGVIHQYYKRILSDLAILVQINPDTLQGLELLISPEGQMIKTSRQFDSGIYDDLAVDGFESASPLEFNLYLKGLASPDFSV